MFSAALAAGSVGLNYYGNLLTESKRVELQKEVRAVAAVFLQRLQDLLAHLQG